MGLLLIQSAGTLTICLFTVLLTVLVYTIKHFKSLRHYCHQQVATTTSDGLNLAPGPSPWPVLGSLHLLGQYEVPFEAFTALSKIYGEIFRITLGSSECVVVNSYRMIKEVLITKGNHFGGRPNFIRFHKLFGGDRDNCKYIFSIFFYHNHYYLVEIH